MIRGLKMTRYWLTSPMKNVGNEYPIRAVPIDRRSGHRPRFSAARMPTSVPPVSHRMQAPTASTAVTGSRLLIRSVTFSLRLKEEPKQGAGHSKAAVPEPYARPTKTAAQERAADGPGGGAHPPPGPVGRVPEPTAPSELLLDVEVRVAPGAVRRPEVDLAVDTADGPDLGTR